MWASYDIRSQPAFVFIDDDGTTDATGSLGRARIEEALDALIAS